MSENKEIIKLLLVEDNPVDANVVTAYLGESNGVCFELEHAASLTLGLEWLARQSFDAVLLDLHLPDSSGLETFRRTHRRFPHLPVVVITGDEVPETPVEAMREGAADYLFKSQLTGPVVSRAVRYAVERTARRRAEEALAHTRRELDLAREIQQGLFPVSPPVVPGLDIAGASIPAMVMGGDFYDYFELEDGSVAIALGDAMGHGLAAALLCAETRAALLSVSRYDCGVGEMVTGANRAISTRSRETSFVTLFLARFDTRRRSLTYTSAGHGYGAVLGASGDIKHELLALGLPLGVDPDGLYGQIEIEALVPGDVVLLVSDGICEAGAVKDDPFGRERAFDVVREFRQESARDIVDALGAVVRQHCNPDPLTDDVTAVVLKVEHTGD